MNAALIFDSPVSAAFEVDRERRTIRGLAVPYGKVGISRGRRFRFSKGTIRWTDPTRVKILIGHDFARAVGVATAFEDTDEGLYITAKIARGPAGDEALSMAEDKVWDGLSIGIGHGAKYHLDEGGVFNSLEVPLIETSITPIPSFEDARIQSVAASAAHNRKEPTVGNENTETTTEAPAATVTVDPPSFDKVTDSIEAAFTKLVEKIDEKFDLSNPQGGREVVSNAGVESVNEPLPYRFDGAPAEHSFTDDLRAMANGNADAGQRLDKFMSEAFAVDTTGTSDLNPTQHRPELYVPQLTYTRPLWDLCSTGTVTDVTPFTIPKFSSATGLVGVHTEGTEPTPGTFTAEGQTVTPKPVSGKVEINREVWDQGGSPKADQIIWREMLNAYFEAIESRIATMLNGLTLTEINLADAEDAALVDAVTQIFLDLQFVRGGNRYTAFASDGQLFPKLAQAADTTGRKLLPMVSPQNASGNVSGGFDRVALGNQTIRAAWALGSGVADHSYLFVPSSVWAWASAPKRFTFEYQVKSVDMAIWGYGAEAVLRDSDVKRIDYTTADA